jgi:hypothetical protein
VTGIFRLTARDSWHDVVGGPAPGGLPAALARMREAGGGRTGNPKDSVKMVFCVRPFAYMTGLKAAGVVHEQPGPAERVDKSELYAMFDTEHIVNPSDVTATTRIFRSRQEADESKSQPALYSERSVLRAEKDGVQEYTVFDTDALPKPLHRLFDSEKLKQRLRRKDPNVPVVRVFLVYFLDGFGVFSKLHHSTSGGYVTLGGLPRHLQDLLRNLVPLHMVPPGADLRKSLEPFLLRVLQLEEGVYLDLGPKIGWVFLVGGLALIRADMPQGHDFASNRRQSAKFGCRQCTQKKADWHQVLSPLEVAPFLRTVQGTRKIREEVKASGKYISAMESILRKVHGLKASAGPLEGLMFDQYRQMPYEPMHLEKLGLAKKILNCFFSSLNADARRELNNLLVQFPTIHPWSSGISAVQLTVPSKIADAKVKMTATDAGKLCSILGLVLRGWVRESCFERQFVRRAVAQFGQGGWVSEVVSAVILVAQSTSAILATHRSDACSYEHNLHCVVRAAREKCFEIWPNKFNNPTVHAGSHAGSCAREQAGAINCKCGKCENKHQQMRQGMRSLNGRFTPEEQMMISDNQRHSGMFMAQGGHVHLDHEYQPGPGFLKKANEPFVKKMLARTCTTKTYVGGVVGGEDVAAYTGSEETAVGVEVTMAQLLHPLSRDDWSGLRVDESVGDRDEAVKLCTVLRFGCVQMAEAEPLRAFQSVALSYRPPYCREVIVGNYYTVKCPRLTKGWAVAYLKAVIQDAALKYWAVLMWMVPSGITDERTGLRVLQQAKGLELRMLTDVLEPRHVVHLCDGNCETLGAGFSGVHGDLNEFLDNEFFLW